MVGADVDEAIVGGEVIDAVRNRLADRVTRKVVDVDQVGYTLGLPFPTPVLEVADELLLLGIDGDHRDPLLDAVLGGGVDVLELRVAVWVLGSLDGFVGRLKAVAVIAKHLGHRLVAGTDAVLREQLGGEHRRALAHPAQRRFWVSARDGIDELLQLGPSVRMLLLVRTLASTFASNVHDIAWLRAGARLVPALPHRADGQARHARHTAPTDRMRFAPCP
jgi:hypothetical protein